MDNITAVLVLQNGQIFQGQGFGSQSIRYGECVFTTAMTGYSESLTDPSYAGQILCFACPLIGNIGTAASWYESEKIYASGVIVSSLSQQGFHFEQNRNLAEFLEHNNRGGIQGIDTRALVQTLRDQGNQPCVLIVGKTRIEMLRAIGLDLVQNIDPKTFEQLTELVDNIDDIGFVDWARQVSVGRFDNEKLKLKSEKLENNTLTDCHSERPSEESHASMRKGSSLKLPLDKELAALAELGYNGDIATENKANKTIVVLDCGVKLNILRELEKRVKSVIVVPADTDCQKILRYKPDGVLLSNGPGDPRDYSYAVQTVKELLDQNLAIMGICLGHQLLSLAIGGEVYKMKFGNRGANQPVQDLMTQKAYLTSQNHGYATKAETIPADYQIYFQNLNDQTVEGIIHITKPIFSVQFHPEACGGPQDTNFLFDKFINSL